MSTEVLTQSLVTTTPAKFGAGTFFLIVAATANLTIVATSIGNSNKNRTFANVGAGFKFQADSQDDGFDYLTVTTAANQVVSLAIGTDDVQFSNNVTVSNTVNTSDLPSGTVTTAGFTVATANQNGPGANLSRRRITFCAPATNTGTIYVQAAGTNVAGQGAALAPGTFVQFNTTASLQCRNDTGATQSFSVMEES
jgi:hypothetical protein